MQVPWTEGAAGSSNAHIEHERWQTSCKALTGKAQRRAQT